MFQERTVSHLINIKAFDKLAEIVRSVDFITRNLWPSDVQSHNTESVEHIVISHIRHYEQLEKPSKRATRRLVQKITSYISSSLRGVNNEEELQQINQLFKNEEMSK